MKQSKHLNSKKYCKTRKKDHHTKQDSNSDGQISNLVAPGPVSTPHSGVGMILSILDSPALLALLIVVQMTSFRQALHDNCLSSTYTPFLWYLQIPEDSIICFHLLHMVVHCSFRPQGTSNCCTTLTPRTFFKILLGTIVYYIPTKPESSKHTSFALKWKHTQDFLDNGFIKLYLSWWPSCNVCFMRSCPTYFVMDRGILISQCQLCREWTEYKYWEKIRLPKVGNMLSTTCYVETNKWWTLCIIIFLWSGYFYLHLRDWEIEIE